MNIHPKINIQESLQSGELIYDDKNYPTNKFGHILNTLIYLVYICPILLLLSDFKRYNDLPSAIFYVLITVLLGICLYGIYRSLNHNTLDQIVHNLSKNETRKKLQEYFKERKWELVEEYEDIIIIRTKTFNNYSYYTFINTQNLLYFNIIKKGFRKFGTTALGHLIFKSNFRHHLNNIPNTNT